MNFNLPDETKMIQDTVRRFVDSELIPLEQKFPDRLNSADLPDDIHSTLVGKVEQLGCYGCSSRNRWRRARAS